MSNLSFLVLIFSEWRPFLKVISDTYTSHGITYVFFNIFFISDFALKSLNPLKMIFSMAIHVALISFFYMWASRFPAAFIEDIISLYFWYICQISGDYSCIYSWLGPLFSLMIYISAFVPISYCSHNYGSLLYLEILYITLLALPIFLRISLDIWSILWTHTNFMLFFSLYVEYFWIWVKIALNH